MTSLHIVVFVLYVVSGVLPLIAMINLLFRAKWKVEQIKPNVPGEARIAMSQPDGTRRFVGAGDLFNAVEEATEAPVLDWRKAKQDLLLVGGGVLAGSIGGCVSLWL